MWIYSMLLFLIYVANKTLLCNRLCLTYEAVQNGAYSSTEHFTACINLCTSSLIDGFETQ